MLNLPPTDLSQLSERSLDTSKIKQESRKTRKRPQVNRTKYISEVVSNKINPKSRFLRNPKPITKRLCFPLFRSGTPRWTKTSRMALNVTARGSGLAYYWIMTLKDALVPCSKTAGEF